MRIYVNLDPRAWLPGPINLVQIENLEFKGKKIYVKK
jgi:hypothetical protein